MTKEMLITIGRPVTLTSTERLAFNESVLKKMEVAIMKPLNYEGKPIGTIKEIFFDEENALKARVECTDEGYDVAQGLLQPRQFSFSMGVG